MLPKSITGKLLVWRLRHIRQRQFVLILSIIVGGVVKIGVNWFLVGDRAINIHGAPIGSFCCYVVICTLNYIFLCRSLKRAPRLDRVLLRPLLSSAVMGVTAWAVYGLLSRLLAHGRELGRWPMAAALLLALAAAVAVYAVMISVTRTVTREDMKLMPRGEKIARFLRLRDK